MMAGRLGELLANQPAAVAGVPEGVHQMRIAIRRLRTALALFEPHLEPHTAAQFGAELRRIGQVLGGARDWDVFCLETLPKALRDGPGAAWEPALREAAEAARGEAGRGVGQEFGQPALTSLALGLAAWLEDARAVPALVGDGRLQRPLSKIASPMLERLARKVAKRGRRIGRRSAEELHALRKAMKKLRYAVEDLAGLYDARAVEGYVAACKKLQKQLGLLERCGRGGGTRPALGCRGPSGPGAGDRRRRSMVRAAASQGRPPARPGMEAIRACGAGLGLNELARAGTANTRLKLSMRP